MYGRRDHGWHALTAELGGPGIPVQPVSQKSSIGFLEAVGGGDDAVPADVALAVALGVDRVEDLRSELAGFIENGLDDVVGVSS